MNFSSPLFLFLFLPAVLPLYFLSPRPLRNAVLLVASVIFYAWGEPKYLLVMLGSVTVNYLLALLMHQAGHGARRKGVLALAVTANLSALAVFKYAAFLVENLNSVLALLKVAPFALPQVELPLGISFFTFHALSYVVDVYRQQTPPQKNPALAMLYVSFFPQLIAGPIVRYHEISDQLADRPVVFDDISLGLRRFVLGLGKKVLIANTLAVQADAIFNLPQQQLTPGIAWLGVLFYALQIYFDFSGYSDMAIGLARVFGFHFPENFNYPYFAASLTDFWRRWHMSLSRFFRDYLYIPLGGNRGSPARTWFNLVTVFFFCGLWHGASWNFVIWGLIHGFFLVMERLRWGTVITKVPLLGRAYTLFIVLIAWVFFRADKLPVALDFLKAMAGSALGSGREYNARYFLDTETTIALTIALAGSVPLLPLWETWRDKLRSAPARIGLQWAGLLTLCVVCLLCVLRLSAGTYNPFIYFRF